MTQTFHFGHLIMKKKISGNNSTPGSYRLGANLYCLLEVGNSKYSGDSSSEPESIH
jgi:hypothetical protein